MIKKPRNNHPTTLATDALAEVDGGTGRGRRKPPPRRRGRVRTFLTEEQKRGGRTSYSTDGDDLFYKGRRLSSLDELI